MTNGSQVAQLQALIRRIHPDGTVLEARTLAGGISAQITAVEVKLPDGHTHILVVRRHGEIDRAHNPNIARDECRLLQIAEAHGLAAPRPYLVDETGELFPFPVLVIEFVDGETDFEPADLASYLDQMAGALARIHGVPDSPDLAFIPRQDKGFGDPPISLDESLSEGRIRAALTAAWPLAQTNPSVLLHGDFWPGNILWRDGRLTAVIDWEDARVGDPLADLGNARLELLWWFGPEAMAEFTRRYLGRTDIDPSHLPYWDLCAALRPCGKLGGWGLDRETEQRMRDLHHTFVSEAIDGLTATS